MRPGIIGHEFNLLGLKARYRVGQWTHKYLNPKTKHESGDLSMFNNKSPNLQNPDQMTWANYYDKKSFDISKILNKKSMNEWMEYEKDCLKKAVEIKKNLKLYEQSEKHSFHLKHNKSALLPNMKLQETGRKGTWTTHWLNSKQLNIKNRINSSMIWDKSHSNGKKTKNNKNKFVFFRPKHSRIVENKKNEFFEISKNPEKDKFVITRRGGILYTNSVFRGKTWTSRLQYNTSLVNGEYNSLKVDMKKFICFSTKELNISHNSFSHSTSKGKTPLGDNKYSSEGKTDRLSISFNCNRKRNELSSEISHRIWHNKCYKGNIKTYSDKKI